MKSVPNAFENVRGQIGVCGIWCGGCVVGNGTLKELTARYKDLIELYGLEKWAPEGLNYGEFLEELAVIQSMSVCPGCRKGGGRDNCEMKTCAATRDINYCGQCPEPATCKYSELLQRMRSGGLAAGLSVKTDDIDEKSHIEKWTASLKNQWPSFILFMQEKEISK